MKEVNTLYDVLNLLESGFSPEECYRRIKNRLEDYDELSPKAYASLKEASNYINSILAKKWMSEEVQY